MKVAVIIVRTASGWKLHSVGEDVGALKSAFKDIKIAGAHSVGEEAASVALYFDTGGNLRRKRLNAPEETQRVDAANGKVAADAATLAAAQAEATAAAEGRAQAVAIAQKAVAVVTAEVAAFAAPQPPAPLPPAPVAQAPAPQPVAADAAGMGGEQDEDAEGDAAARFAGKKSPAKPAKK